MIVQPVQQLPCALGCERSLRCIAGTSRFLFCKVHACWANDHCVLTESLSIVTGVYIEINTIGFHRSSQGWSVDHVVSVFFFLVNYESVSSPIEIFDVATAHSMIRLTVLRFDINPQKAANFSLAIA